MPKLAPQTKLTELCSNAIEAFHRTLGGRTFRHEKVGHGGNATCPFASGCTIGLRPLPTILQSHETSTNSWMNWFSDSSKYIQFGAPKYINGKLENPRMMYLIVGSE